MRARTLDEMKAYVQGYNICFDQFMHYLQISKNVREAIGKMRAIREAVNAVIEEEE